MSDVADMTTPWRRQPAAVQAGLEQWARRVGGGADVADLRVPQSGMSNDTVLFSLDGEPVVARLAPAPGSPCPTFPTYDLEAERRVIDLVRRRTAVPAPEVVHHEPSDEWLGVPFIVIRAVEGVVPGDNPPYLLDPGGWFLQGTSEDWARLEAGSIALLPELHRVADGEDTAFLHLDTPGATPLDRLLADQRAYYEWAREGHMIPMLERALDVLSATVPTTNRSVLLWGDGRPGNIIYRDFEPVAALDWEMAGVGPPELDVAWMTFFHRFFASVADQFGLPPVPVMFDRAETAATYHRLGGVELDDLAWYEAFAGLRFGIIVARMTLRAVAFGAQAMPDDTDQLVLFTPLLDRLLAEI